VRDVTKMSGISSYAYLGRMAGVPSHCSTHGMKMNWQEHWLHIGRSWLFLTWHFPVTMMMLLL